MVQLKLVDGTELILDSNNKRVMFIDLNSELSIIPLKDALNRQIFPEDNQLVLRLKYMKKAVAYL
mgnify:CR=1 FL=1